MATLPATITPAMARRIEICKHKNLLKFLAPLSFYENPTFPTITS
jgi:hypothetical protein